MKKEITIILIVMFTAAGFFGGMEYQKTQTRTVSGNRLFQGNNNFPRPTGQIGQFQRGGSGRVVGEILNIDDKSITVKMPDGSSKIVIISDNTSYNKSSEGSKDDLKVGEQIGVFGSLNPDGSVTAQDVQINPLFRITVSPASGQ